MNRVNCVVLLVSSALTVLAQEPTATSHDVVACLQVDTPVNFAVVGMSKIIASRVYERIGVRLRWSCRPLLPTQPVDSSRVILIRLAGNTSGHLHPEALGFARPYAKTGVRVVVFYDRFEPIIVNRPVSASAILGYVFAHEIGHVLSAVAAHADRGLMSARWTSADFHSMAGLSLSFAPEEAKGIRKNLERNNLERSSSQRARTDPSYVAVKNQFGFGVSHGVW